MLNNINYLAVSNKGVANDKCRAGLSYNQPGNTFSVSNNYNQLGSTVILSNSTNASNIDSSRLTNENNVKLVNSGSSLNLLTQAMEVVV